MTKRTNTIETIDTSTGEVTRIERTFSFRPSKDEAFYITFLSGANALCNLSTPSDIKVLSYLCTRASYNTGQVSFTSRDRKDLALKLKTSSQGISNSINRLKKEGLLAGERGEYEINPQFFWKGTTDERRSLLKNKTAELILKYSVDDK